MTSLVVDLFPPVELRCSSEKEGHIELTFRFSSEWEPEKFGSGTLTLHEGEVTPPLDEGTAMLDDYLRLRGDPMKDFRAYKDIRAYTGIANRQPLLGYFILRPPYKSELQLVIPKPLFREILAEVRRGVCPKCAQIRYQGGEPLPQSAQQLSNPILVVIEFSFQVTLFDDSAASAATSTADTTPFAGGTPSDSAT